MKPLILSTLVLLSSFTVMAQFPDYFANNPEWRIDASGDPPCIYNDEKVFFVAGDSIVDDISYKVLNYRVYTTYSQEGPWPTGCPGPTYYEGLHGLYRQEERSIYKIESGNDELVANYNYQVGDSIFQYGYFTGGIIDSISVEQIGEQDRLQFWYGDVQQGWEQSFIEGISSISYISGELFSTYAQAFISMYNPRYICFSENGETVHENPYNWEGACYFNVSVSENQSIEVGVFPNPFDDKFSVSSSENAVYRILNSAGQRVQEGVISIGEQSLPTQELNKGVYFLQVSSENGGFSVHRLVKM